MHYDGGTPGTETANGAVFWELRYRRLRPEIVSESRLRSEIVSLSRLREPSPLIPRPLQNRRRQWGLAVQVIGPAAVHADVSDTVASLSEGQSRRR